MANYLPYINEFFMIVSGLCVALGWIQIKRKNIELHKRLMITGSICAALFFIGYSIKTLFVGDTSFGGPHTLKPAYEIFLSIHSILATVGAILGIMSLWLARKKAFIRHKKLGPWTANVWFITVITGFAVFLLLYIIYPPGPTTHTGF